ncbi:transcriptional regulator, GntR family [Syntrophobotulus glycolicus DSM 8271]|uniref:Transcriptional regulator, GntR family n=1 Tax=Syntrophobotulus glycolicus (strain DSM 8271 / FlGlyR) TaxID=645991 RepID=F0T2U1_SYNGF|nr:GntR family transcriptional regulator [Syntrophobotulus glycolicus]ADY57578.1 transcriptional regulator, GntR family [Syntrophobotulus glycolicus DSM 8271]
MSKIPSYRAMYDLVKNDIKQGKYLIGELLPTESELEKIFHVSRSTVRRAMELLAQDGLVSIKQGRGTTVMDFKTKQDLNKVTSVTESLRRKGYIVRTKSMYIDTVGATEKLAQELQVMQGDLLARVQRIQLADEKPVVIMKNYIPYHTVPNIEQYTNQFSALYQFLEQKYQIEIDAAKDKIYAKPADFTDSEMLCVAPGTALLCIRRICYKDQKPVCVDQVSILGDQYELEVSMSGRYK